MMTANVKRIGRQVVSLFVICGMLLLGGCSDPNAKLECIFAVVGLTAPIWGPPVLLWNGAKKLYDALPSLPEDPATVQDKNSPDNAVS